MSSVHQLPDSMERQWRVFADAVRQGLLRRDCTPHEVDTALVTLKPVYIMAATPKTFSGTGDQLVEAINIWVHDQVATLLIALAVREIELQRAGAR